MLARVRLPAAGRLPAPVPPPVRWRIPALKQKAFIVNEDEMRRAIVRISHEIVERNRGVADIALVGIRRRGLPLAERIRENIRAFEEAEIPLGALDITLYRDDLTTISSSPVLKRTEISFPVEGKTIVLCDDVLFTGRTVRAAIDAVLDFGRPKRVLLAVLVDRGRRELPIEAQFVGKKISTSSTEIVSVSFRETDGEDDVWLLDREIEVRPKRPAVRAAQKGTKGGARKQGSVGPHRKRKGAKR